MTIHEHEMVETAAFARMVNRIPPIRVQQWACNVRLCLYTEWREVAQ